MSNEVKKKTKNSKKLQQQHQDCCDDDNGKKLSKDEEAVAKYLRFNCPTKKANLEGNKVDYFIGSKAIDFLMSSKFATQDAKNQQILFKNRESCKQFLQELLNKELFHRALKVYKQQEQIETTAAITTKTETTPENTPQPRKRKIENEKSNATPSATPVASSASSDKNNEEKSKRKFKLDMHDKQVFLDSSDPYVWIYDPPTTKSIIVGTLLVIGAIGVCLFPLWPSIVREGVYYISLAGAGFLGVILGLCVLKYIIFALVFVITVGSVRFWLLPNLTEDVGFFESFVPFYKINGKSSNDNKNNNKTSKIEESKINEEKKKETAAEEFNKLPLDEQLMKKFDENISDNDDGGDDENKNNNKNDEDDVDDDYDMIEKDDDLKNN